MTEEEQRSYAELSFRRDSLTSCIESHKAQIAKLSEDLRSVNREQDTWIAVFSLHHDVDINVKDLKVDIVNGIVVLR